MEYNLLKRTQLPFISIPGINIQFLIFTMDTVTKTGFYSELNWFWFWNRSISSRFHNAII